MHISTGSAIGCCWFLDAGPGCVFVGPFGAPASPRQKVQSIRAAAEKENASEKSKDGKDGKQKKPLGVALPGRAVGKIRLSRKEHPSIPCVNNSFVWWACYSEQGTVRVRNACPS